MSKAQNSFLTIIFLLMIVTGFIYYFIYLKSNDGFLIDPLTGLPIINPPGSAAPPPGSAALPPGSVAPPPGSAALPPGSGGPFDAPIDPLPICQPGILPGDYKSILSRYFGVGFNIIYVNQNNTDLYMINHIPTLSTGILGGCYAITNDNLLTIRLRNSADNSQLWTMTSYDDDVSTYYVVSPLNNNTFALQYENGSLSLRPLNLSNLFKTSSITSIFEGQKWLLNTSVITRGIPVLNYSSGSLFTPEFDPYNSQHISSTLTDQNSQQINDVITAVRSGIQQYLGELGNKNQSEEVTASSLGQVGTPLNVNLNLSSPKNQLSPFANVDKTAALSKSMLSTMDKYGPSANSGGRSGNSPLYNQNSLQNEISNYQGCKLMNINDYTSNRVSSCNCKL